MLTVRQAALLLSRANDLPSLEPFAAALGCAQSAPLDAAALRGLGIDEHAQAARIAAGSGALRALLVDVTSDRATRDVMTSIATRLARSAPHVLWIVIAVQRDSGVVSLAAWNGDRRPPRVSALVARTSAITDSDAETLRALAAVSNGRDVLVHARWVDVLGREALGARFYRGLEAKVRGLALSARVGREELRDRLALLDASRLLFLCFLQAKGWLDGDRDFLASRFDTCARHGGGFRERVLRPLFFGTLNTPRARRSRAALAFGNIPFLNGGLFARAAEERSPAPTFSDDAYGSLIHDLFAQYRFTALEESADWNEAAIDPEMLGRAFESLMASGERRGTGAFFTPFSLVERVTAFGLEDVFALDDRRALERLTLIDPACGSGAFLVHALECISGRLRDLGDSRDVTAIRRDTLTRSIFGVDVNPTAVWLCQLRLWLSVVIESAEDDPTRVAPLPNLDRNIRVGDALAALDSDSGAAAKVPGLQRLRQRYARATGPRKRSLGRELDRIERARALATIDRRLDVMAGRRQDLLAARRGRDLFGDRYRASREERDAATNLRRTASDLRRVRRRVAAGAALPFSFHVHFADVAARGGFDVVLGNPPWIRLHNISPDQRAAFRREYFVARHAAWDFGASLAGAGAGFGAQVDASALFIERSGGLLSPRGVAALLVPAKLWRSLAGGGVRRFLSERAVLRRIEDYSDAPAAFDAAVYPSLVVFARTTHDEYVDVATSHAGHEPLHSRLPRASIALDDSAGAPWVTLPSEARVAFDRLRHAGVALARSSVGRPVLGVKCGCNEAFIVELLGADDERALVRSLDGRTFEVERFLVRPLLRGEQLRRWAPPEHALSILWTHDAAGAALASLPPLAAKWFQRWRGALMARSDGRRAARWWSLFRTEGARAGPRVVWNDVGREPRAAVIHGRDPSVPLNTCYVARMTTADDADAFAALLNGPVARAWLDAIAEPARGGYRRYLGWTLSLMPRPADWPRARGILAPLAAAGRRGRPPSESDLFDASVAAYGLERDEVAPLVAWMSR